jgi:hypothetical protein
MLDARELYEMVTKEKPPQPGALERQQKRQVRAARNKRLGALAVAAMIGVIALIVVLRPGEHDTTVPATGSPSVDPAETAAIQVVTDFHQAYWVHDADKASTYLADDADLSGFVGAGGASAGSPKMFRLQIAWDEATGMKEMLDSCAATILDPGTIGVTCTYDWHGLRSDEIGLGPYTGSSADYIVRDGKIVGAGPGSLDTSEFSPEMWEPFVAWVSATYPADAEVMYNADLSNYVLTRASIRLWDRRTRGYVREVNQGNLG